jgi:hypothetical protein
MTWLSWSWQAQGLFCCLIRKLDRAGLMELEGFDAAVVVSVQTRWPLEVVQKHLPELMKPGQSGIPTIDVSNGCLIATAFVEAQNAAMSDAKRSKEYRARKREMARAEKYGVRAALRVTQPREGQLPGSHADLEYGPRETLPEGEDSPFDPGEPFRNDESDVRVYQLNRTETPHSAEQGFTGTTGSVAAQNTETPHSASTETPDSTVTKRDANERYVSESTVALRSVTNRRELTRQEREEKVFRENSELSVGRASAPALSHGFAKKTPTARGAAGGEPEEVAQVFDWLWAARKQIQPRCKRERCCTHTTELVFRPMRELGASLHDWKRAIAGQLADVKSQKDKSKYRFLSLDTLSKPQNFRTALDHADAHGIPEPLTEAQAASEREARERAEAEQEAERLRAHAEETERDDQLIADTDARLAALDALLPSLAGKRSLP